MLGVERVPERHISPDAQNLNLNEIFINRTYCLHRERCNCCSFGVITFSLCFRRFGPSCASTQRVKVVSVSITSSSSGLSRHQSFLFRDQTLDYSLRQGSAI